MTGAGPTIGAVILAAGFGTRLAPLTNHTPKPLLMVGGAPVVSRLVDQLLQVQNVSEIVVVVNDQHRDQWQAWASGMHATPVRVVSNGVVANHDRPGAVADLRMAVVELDLADWIMVMAGDNLLDESLQPHIDHAISSGEPVVLCRDLGEHVPPGRFGEISVDDDGHIVRFREKPAEPESPLAATCTYVLPGSICADLDEYLSTGNTDSPGRFMGWLAARRAVSARVLSGAYFDIGNLETLAQARAAWQ